jgi:hypothetical protein
VSEHEETKIEEFNNSARETLRLGQILKDELSGLAPSWMSERFAALFTDKYDTVVIRSTRDVEREQDEKIIEELSDEWREKLRQCRERPEDKVYLDKPYGGNPPEEAVEPPKRSAWANYILSHIHNIKPDDKETSK